jgi:lysozyme
VVAAAGRKRAGGGGLFFVPGGDLLVNVRVQVAALSLSATALVGIALHEGFRDRAYDDGVGVMTVGFGTTEGVKPGDRITVERALIRLATDADRMQQRLRACIQVPMHQHEWDAIVSWAYNVGVRCDSTLIRKLNAGDYEGACNELPRWVYAGGRKLAGLERRRAEEQAKCLGR